MDWDRFLLRLFIAAGVMFVFFQMVLLFEWLFY